MVVDPDGDPDPEVVLRNAVVALAAHSVCSIAIIGPDVTAVAKRKNYYAWPAKYAGAADVLARSKAFDEDWIESDAPLVAWTDTGRQEEWLERWHELGTRFVVRIAFELPGKRAFEVYVGSTRKLLKPDIAEIVRDIMAYWPLIKSGVLMPISVLSLQQRRVLLYAFEGMTAKESAAAMGVVERTVIHHLTAAQEKLGAKNKLDSIRKAIWCGAI